MNSKDRLYWFALGVVMTLIIVFSIILVIVLIDINKTNPKEKIRFSESSSEVEIVEL